MVYRIENLSFSFGRESILSNLSFQIASGEFFGILGPNGCGKTTLIKLLSGILKPAEGSIDLNQRDLRSYSRREIAREVAVLPQDNIIDFPFSAEEVALMGRAPYLGNFRWEGSRDRAVVQSAMEQTDCIQFAHRDIRSLSGGERERVLLARALSQEPKVLLLDEPTTHLDLQHQQETFRLLRHLNKEKKLTLVVVLHDLNFASQSCDRLLLLKDAKIHSLGEPGPTLTPENIRQVFGVPVHVQEILGGRPWIRPQF